MSQFIESIKIEDRKIFLLELHQKRVNETFAFFGKENNLDVAKIYEQMNQTDDGLYKFRMVYDLDNNFKTQLIPYAFPQIDQFKIVEDNNIDYSFKFEERTVFTKMKNTAKSAEIIIVKNNHLTDSSYANLLFLKGKQWFTPSTFLLNGVQRQHLLHSKKIKETEITLQNLKEFTHFQIINAMNTMDNDFVYPIEKIRNLSNHQ